LKRLKLLRLLSIRIEKSFRGRFGVSAAAPMMMAGRQQQQQLQLKKRRNLM